MAKSSIIRQHGTEVGEQSYQSDVICDACADKVRALIWIRTFLHTIALCLRCAKDVERDISESIGIAIASKVA